MWLKIFFLMSAVACLLAGNIPELSSFQIHDLHFKIKDFAGFFWAALCYTYATDPRQMEPKRKGIKVYLYVMTLAILLLAIAGIARDVKNPAPAAQSLVSSQSE